MTTNIKKKMEGFDLFRPTKSDKERKRRWLFINRSFKFYFLTPLIRLGKRVLGRWLVSQRKQIPDEIWNENFYIFYDSVQEAIGTYYDDFLMPMNLVKEKNNKKITAQTWKSKRESYMRGKSRGPEAIQFLRNMSLTIALEDTAYREFLNIWMFKIQELMNKKWNPQIRHRVPLYISNMNNFMPYYAAWKMKQSDVSMFQVQQIKRPENWRKVGEKNVKKKV